MSSNHYQQRLQETRVAAKIIEIVQSLANQINCQLKENGGKGLVSDSHFPNHRDWQVPQDVFQYRLDKIVLLCNIAKRIFSEEERVVKVSGPTVIFGDLHGNLADVLLYERLFWPRIPDLVLDNVVFLGDYVDRGLQSLEVFLYILALKVMDPHKFTVLRGNHETRQMHVQFSFRKECLAKFGRDLGQEVWLLLNEVMDSIPFCAVVNDTIFCAHGGIPTSAKTIRELNMISNDLPSPESEAPPVWEIMWNDPATQAQIEEGRGSLGNISTQKGFMPNIKRGAGFFYSEVAVDRFLKDNGLTHIIRAHEMKKQGFSFHFDGKVVTVFSCSFYSGLQNTAAVMRVEDNKIIPIQIKTMNQEDY